MNAETKVENGNLAIWQAVSKTDPKHTKAFKRAGGFSGTALKPIWIVKMLTEQFGPVGTGWGMGESSFQVVPGDHGEVLVYCTVKCWHGHPENTFYGVGGDKIVTHIKANAQYNRPERWENDDEAFKKAFTDAVNNAFKFLGVGADIHMGQFEDSKYLKEVAAEFEAREAADEPAQKVEGISKIKVNLRALKTAGDAMDSLETFNELLASNRDDLTKIKEANHQWWTGDGADFEGFRDWIVRRRAELSEDHSQFQMLVESMKQCETLKSLTNWMATNEAMIAELDGADSRKFEMAYQLHESAILQMDKAGA